MKIQSPWMGRVKGSAGNMTGSKVYDKNVLRAKAFEVSNPNTAAQQTERNFFAQVADCCASVSEDQLRSLFGVKPKSMSRRNALTKQVSAAYSIDGTFKTLDFSKLLAIGNGQKVTTQIVHSPSGDESAEINWSPEELGITQNDANIIFVIFDATDNTLNLRNSQFTASKHKAYLFEIDYPNILDHDLYIYATCATDGSNVYLRGFGSFIIKTRAEK